ncbi:alpha/beta fold hydrolase [Microbacterium esteraromaticum]|uniref:alpha/beta fold hydrolase n=1 Tax=Microbacterium esteraromaticum TaxID=57043 RepID=UPI000B35F26A|nr:alpha/beta hydrolase [Microbacterium esteraromaticum]
MAVAHDTSEFRYLPAQADVLHATVPAAQRLSVALPDGRTLSMLRFGEGDPEVTLLHGAGLNAHTWDSVVLLLGRPALVIDLAGHGDSSWRDDLDYSPAALAADVAHAITAQTAQPQVLVGHSLGGLTAAVVAAQHPALIRELLLVDIVPALDTAAAPAVLREFYGVTDFDTRDDIVERAMSFGFGGTREDTARGVFFNTRVREDGRVEWKHHFAQIIGHAFDALADANTRPDAADPWTDLTAVQAPVTLIRGTHGFLQDSDVAEFTRRLPTASVVTADAGHNVQETSPATIAELASAALIRLPN